MENQQHLSGQPTEIQYKVDLEPVGRRALIEPGMTLLDAARCAGVEIVAVCGGVGACGKCRVRLVYGEVTPPTPAEVRVFSAAELAGGFRLACQARPLGDVKIDIPPASLSTPQRLQVEGQESEVTVDPVAQPADVTVVPATLHDLRPTPSA